MKQFFNRATFVRNKGIILLSTCCGLLSFGTYTLVTLGKEALHIRTQQIAIDYMLKIAQQNSEINREADIAVMVLDNSIEMTKYIENKHIADSLKSDCENKKAEIKHIANESLQKNTDIIKQIAKEYNIALR